MADPKLKAQPHADNTTETKMSTSTLMAASLAFSFAAYPVYARGIYRDNARPTRPTWIMILVSDLLLFFFMLSEARWDWLTLGFTAGNLMMLALMAWSDLKSTPAQNRQRKRDLTRLTILGRDPWTTKDIASVAVALGALALWAITGSGVTAIFFSLAGKVAASVPMWINLYREPAREALTPWVLWTIGGALYICAIPKIEWSFATLATPVMFLILEIIIIALLLRQFGASDNPAAA